MKTKGVTILLAVVSAAVTIIAIVLMGIQIRNNSRIKQLLHQNVEVQLSDSDITAEEINASYRSATKEVVLTYEVTIKDYDKPVTLNVTVKELKSNDEPLDLNNFVFVLPKDLKLSEKTQTVEIRFRTQDDSDLSIQDLIATNFSLSLNFGVSS